MKYLKMAACALGLLLLASCSDKDDYNTETGVTVEMGSADIQIMESAGTLKVPVVVNGKPNGPVKVTLKVEGTGNNPAVIYEDHNGEWYGDFYLTSDYLNIPADGKIAYALISLIDNRDENEPTTFTISIASAEGAEVGAQSSTLVTIKDNDALPYGKIQGDWNFNYTDINGNATTWKINISGYDEGTEEYENLLTLEGLGGGETYLDLDYIEDPATGEISIMMQLPEPIGWYNASNYIWAFTGGRTPSGSFQLSSGNIIGKVSSDFKQISFDQSACLLLVVATPELDSILGVLSSSTEISMTR